MHCSCTEQLSRMVFIHSPHRLAQLEYTLSKGNQPNANPQDPTKDGNLFCCLTSEELDTVGVVALSMWAEAPFLNDNWWGLYFLHQRIVNVMLMFSSLSNVVTSKCGSLLLSVFCLKVFP